MTSQSKIVGLKYFDMHLFSLLLQQLKKPAALQIVCFFLTHPMCDRCENP